MKKTRQIHASCLLLVTVWLLLFIEQTHACSMYKITVNGKTMVGNNEDSWGRDACIWFEPASNENFGVAYVGYARKRPLPDGAINDQGLVFDAFTMPHRTDMPPRDPGKKDFSYADLRLLMQHCQNVDEVDTFLKERNLHVLNGSVVFNGGMLFFADQSGSYLIVEAHKITRGHEDHFALANFSIADTKDTRSVQMTRYRKGMAFLSNKTVVAELPFCTALSDTMSVHRNKIGDGTLYTSIYELNEGWIHLYFYHDFSRRISFRLREELSKGPHAYALSTLFPNNSGFQKLVNYQTPGNNKGIMVLLTGFGLLFAYSVVHFLFAAIRRRHTRPSVALAFLDAVLCMYLLVLLRNEAIFYFPSPYVDPHSAIISASSYAPYLLTIVLLPLTVMLLRTFKKQNTKPVTTILLILNTISYLVLTGLFIYWKLL